MSTIKHILFDLHGTLVDSTRLRPYIAAGVGQLMAARYGHEASEWAQAYAHIQADWHSYFADLHLSGDEGMANLREGLFRTTRALFRLMATPEPDPQEIHNVATLLASESAVVQQDVLFADVLPMLEKICQLTMKCHIYGDTFARQAWTLVNSAGIGQHFEHVFGVDTMAQLDRDANSYGLIAMRCQSAAGACLVVDDDMRHIQAAKASGMKAIHLARKQTSAHENSLESLEALVDWLEM
ncbi:MAG: HAD family hydrolase [Anaerolineaceae bacterium]|nr:HAD family hydrolase [Anaerolineaceae bacterium]